MRLSFRAYECNRRTFEDFLQVGDGKQLVAVVVNPLHHTNSTSISDWAMRRPGTQLHLVQQYTTKCAPSENSCRRASDSPLMALVTSDHPLHLF